MSPPYNLVFDEAMIKQLKKAAKNQHIKQILARMFDKIENFGPNAGKLLDSKLFIYESKSKHPPIRLYFKHVAYSDDIYIFEYEMKTNEEGQQRTIENIQKRLLKS